MQPKRYTALLVDDEEAASQRLSRLLSEYQNVVIAGFARSVAEARAFLEVQKPDLIFLDMEMPGLLGTALLTELSEATQVVLVTAYQEYAVQAFDFGVLDYLLKPVDPGRLEVTMERFFRTRALADRSKSPEDDEDLSLPAELQGKPARETQMIPLESIRWIEGLQNYTRVRLTGQEPPAVVRRRLADWEALLSGDGFCRIGRSHIIRLSALQRTKWVSRDVTELYFEGIAGPLVIGRGAAVHLKELLRNG
jgi:two-component system LytT family response regulator